MTQHRNKSRATTIYLDHKYDRKLKYLKYTCGITKYVESCLDKLQVDDELLRHVDALSQHKP